MAPHDPLMNKRPDGTMGENAGSTGANEGPDGEDAMEAGARARSKSPLVSSAERVSKCQMTAIDTPLPYVPLFPSIIPEGDKGEKGKGGGKRPDPWEREKEKTHGVKGKGRKRVVLQMTIF